MPKSLANSRRRRGGARKGKKQNNGVARVVAPIATGVQMRNNSTDDTTIFKGTEYLSTVGVSASQITETLLQAQLMQPSTLAGTRMQATAALWEYYRYKKLRVYFESTSPTTVGGQICAAFDPSVSDIQQTNLPVNYALALPGAITANVWASFYVDFNCNQKFRQFPWYSCSLQEEDVEIANQCRLLVVLVQPLSGVTGGTNVFWTLRVQYEIEFARKRLAAISQAATVTIAAGTTMSIGGGGLWSVGGFLLPNSEVYLASPQPSDFVAVSSDQPAYVANIPSQGQYWFGTLQEAQEAVGNHVISTNVIGTNLAEELLNNMYLIPVSD